MEGKARFIFPIIATGVIVFVVSAVVTFESGEPASHEIERS